METMKILSSKKTNMEILFHIGPQKCGTTWIYENLKNHPQLRTSVIDSIHYFDIHYNKGIEWYLRQFTHGIGDKFFDPTYTYIRSPLAAPRIAKKFPEAKFALSLRNPIERAFSHYWHEKKKRQINFKFEDALRNYDLFASWI